MIRLIALLGALLAATPGYAANWIVDHENSALGFIGAQEGNEFTGIFRDWSAEIVFDPDALDQARADVAIATGSAHTGDTNKDGALPGRDWFAVNMFPEARFATNGFRYLGEDRYEAEAELTIKSVTRWVTLPFTLTITGDEARMRGELDMLRTNYDVGEGQWSSGETVALPVTVTVDIVAKRAE